jgi:trans-aconitate 2-methyltransferase
VPTRWDPAAYGRFAGERARPFADLVARVDAAAPARVVDLGCGSGALTATLARRWPGARVTGVDASPEMLAEAAAHVLPGRLEFVRADLRAWAPPAPPDVLVTNAALQWVPGHLSLLRRWVGVLAPGGWLALQVPGNQGAATHTALREVAADGPWAGRLATVAGALGPQAVADPAGYAEVLADEGCTVDCWETTYLHVLDPRGEHGDDAVLAWVGGTALRPVLDALAEVPDQREAFVAAYAARLRAAYPRRAWGTPMPFRRVFAVARAGDRAGSLSARGPTGSASPPGRTGRSTPG